MSEVCATFCHGSAVIWESFNVLLQIWQHTTQCLVFEAYALTMYQRMLHTCAYCGAWHELLSLAAGSLLPSSYGRSSCLTHHHNSICSNHSLCSRCSMISIIASAAFRADTHQLLSKSYDICMSVIGFSSIVVHSNSCHLALTSAATAGCMAGSEAYKPKHYVPAVHGCCTPVILYVRSPLWPAKIKHL